jgi:hypothetical protein
VRRKAEPGDPESLEARRAGKWCLRDLVAILVGVDGRSLRFFVRMYQKFLGFGGKATHVELIGLLAQDQCGQGLIDQ